MPHEQVLAEGTRTRKSERRERSILCPERDCDTQQHSKGHLLRGVSVSAEEMARSLKRLPQKLEGLCFDPQNLPKKPGPESRGWNSSDMKTEMGRYPELAGQPFSLKC